MGKFAVIVRDEDADRSVKIPFECLLNQYLASLVGRPIT